MPNGLLDAGRSSVFNLAFLRCGDELVGATHLISQNKRKGCNRVHLPNSELTFKALMWIVENLQGIVMEKLVVETINLSDKEEKKLNDKATFNLEFL